MPPRRLALDVAGPEKVAVSKLAETDTAPLKVGNEQAVEDPEPFSDILIQLPVDAFEPSYNGPYPPSLLPQDQTIYSCPEAELGYLEVPLQTRYTHREVISSQLADTLCSNIGVPEMLNKLHMLLGTRFLIAPDTIAAALEAFSNSNYDFGMAYAFMRGVRLGNLHALKERLVELRRSAIDRDRSCILYPTFPPRRVWDLYANRVVPFWVASGSLENFSPSNPVKWEALAAVSHAWMPQEKRHFIQTPINSGEWPVPIPKDTTLERIRVELLNMGVEEEKGEEEETGIGPIAERQGSRSPSTSAMGRRRIEYAWVDVLCLRQELRASDEAEALRRREWELDVPTIGNMYQRAGKIIVYYNGLGRPFRINDSVYTKYHWVNRAWTLQETPQRPTNDLFKSYLAREYRIPDLSEHAAGITSDFCVLEWDKLDSSTTEFYNRLSTINRTGSTGWTNIPTLSRALSAMLPRSATTELDRIAGLAYILECDTLPIYINNESPEEAWTRLVQLMAPEFARELFLSSAQPGDGVYKWCPSWQQLQKARFEENDLDNAAEVHYDIDSNVFHFRGYQSPNSWKSLDAGVIEVVDLYDDGSQKWVNLSPSKRFGYKARDGWIPDPNVSYTLMGGGAWWAVGRMDELGRFEKLSLIEILFAHDGNEEDNELIDLFSEFICNCTDIALA